MGNTVVSQTQHPLFLGAADFQYLFTTFGPSLGLWRAAEIAALREQIYRTPVLDLGCGDGIVTSRVLERVSIGLDPDADALKQAAQRGIYERLEPSLVERADIPPGSIGTVMSNSALEHARQPDQALAAARRMLQPDGHLIITAPTEAFSPWLAVPWPRYAAWRNQQLAHLNLWNVDEWSRRLKRAGLELETVRPYLRHSLVTLWDALELLQMVWIARRRVLGVAWKRIPPAWMARLARSAARLDLSAPEPGGGRLIVARKV